MTRSSICQRAVAGIIAAAMIIVSRPTHADDDAKARARALNDQGNAAYDLGNYDEACERFSSAFKAYPDARILFNLAQAHRKKQSYERAVELYRSYLRNLPSAPNRRDVEELISDLESLRTRQRAAGDRPPQGTAVTGPLTMPTVTRIEEPRPWYRNSAGWWLGGSGAVAAGVGVALFISAGSLEDRLAIAPEPEKPSIRSDLSTRRTIAAVVSIAGGLALASSVMVFAISPRTVTREVFPIKDLRLSFGPSSVALAGAF